MEYTQESNAYRLKLKALSELLLLLALEGDSEDYDHDEILHTVVSDIQNMKKAIEMFTETGDIEFADSYFKE